MRLIPIAAVAALAMQAGAAAAQDCNGAGSNVEITQCLDRVFRAEDAELNRVWKRANASIDGQDWLSPADRKGWRDDLLAAQRAWIAFKEADCNRAVVREWGGGSGTSGGVLSCLIGKTRERSRELRERYDVR